MNLRATVRNAGAATARASRLSVTLQFGIDDENTPSAGGAVDPAGLGETLLGGATGVKAEGKAGIKACLPPPGK